MSKNDNLNMAKKQKNDEFYTQLSDIENELRHYKQHFRGKVVFCNCDDPYESNFFKYFAMNFNSLGLKKLIATGYATSPVAGKELSQFEDEVGTPKNQPYVAYINEVGDYNGDGRVDLSDVRLLLRMKKNTRRKLYGDAVYLAGDFRSEECIKLLQQSDVVVTNPPFSLFRDYVAQLMEYHKKFIIWGNVNAVTYKEFFPLLKKGLVWVGYTFNSTKIFTIPRYYDKYDKNLTNNKNDGKKYCKVPSISVFTNLDINKRHEKIKLGKVYNSKDYPKYDNYDAINVDKVSEIPCDYDGVMGVPITFLDKYNPNQFEIINGIGRYACIDDGNVNPIGTYGTDINGKHTYFRVLIRKKDDNKSL